MQRADEGMAGGEARVAVYILVLLAFPPEKDHHGEGAQVHERVGEQVVEDARREHLVARDEGDEDIARVGDARIGEEALHVVLHEGGDVARRTW